MVNLSRLAKVWKLTNSPNPGEAAAARERVRVIVWGEGKTLADVLNLLRGQATAAAGPKPGPSGFTFYNMNNPEHRAAHAEHDRKRRADHKLDRRHRNAPRSWLATVASRQCWHGRNSRSFSARRLR